MLAVALLMGGWLCATFLMVIFTNRKSRRRISDRVRRRDKTARHTQSTQRLVDDVISQAARSMDRAAKDHRAGSMSDSLKDDKDWWA